MPKVIEITDFSAPELDVYARLTEAQLLNRFEPKKGMFIAESPKVIMRALDAGCQPKALLMERKHIEGDAAEIIARCGNIPIYTADLFGQKAYTKILGIFVAVNVAGYAVGGPVMNFFFDTFGSYSKILLVMSIVMAVVMLALQFIISAAKKQRRLVEQSEEKNETAEALKA